jgi:hypothetical protein
VAVPGGSRTDARNNAGRNGGGSGRSRTERGSPLMSRDGYGRDEVNVSDRGPRANPADGQRSDRGPRSDNRPHHKRGGPPISGGGQSRDGDRPRNYGPKPSGVGKFKDNVKRAR